MALSILDVASFILRERGEMSTMKLQKLCYFSQGWALAWDDKPLFAEDFQAWANGPVCPPLYVKHRGRYSVSELAHEKPKALEFEQKLIVRSVLDTYSQMSGFQLSELSHKGAPWRVVREAYGASEGERCIGVISKEAMKAYFSSL